MKYDIIYLNGFMYAVDKKAPNQFAWNIHVGKHVTWNEGAACNENFYDRIIATNDPSLNLPLLPAVEEDAMDLAYVHTAKLILNSEQRTQRWWGFQEGYKAASAKQFTEEDLRKAIVEGINMWKDLETIRPSEVAKRYLESLRPKPIAVVLQTKCNLDGVVIVVSSVDNYVKVLQWIY